MNDVLPKPFTKEGLLHMLEKHLAHLKQPAHGGLDMVPPPSAGLHPGSGRTSMKEEESPAKSPATGSTWNSPAQVPGVLPVASTAGDVEYGSNNGHPGIGQPHPGMYAVQNPMQQLNPMTGGGIQQYGPGPPQPRQVSGQHRRQISDISGGPEEQAAKRQQMYPPMQQGVPPHMRGR
jgi:osomolarity two-component system response regulator SKN7